jgi:hypothetical protein
LCVCGGGVSGSTVRSGLTGRRDGGGAASAIGGRWRVGRVKGVGTGGGRRRLTGMVPEDELDRRRKKPVGEVWKHLMLRQTLF